MKTIGKASIEFIQEQNSCGTTTDPEVLTVKAEYQCPEEGKGGECFFVLKTEGWSIDDGKELADLIENARQGLQEISER
jgi:hypothetical protein